MEIRNKDSPIVYICSPYSGDVTHNIEMSRRISGCRSLYRKRGSGNWR